MLQSLPQPKRRNAPWTPLQRRTWLATRRRRGRIQFAQDPGSQLLNGLVAHFGFDESSGDWIDDVGGQILQAVGGSPQRVAGLHDLAVKFTNDGGALLGTQVTSVFSPTAAGFAISFWVNLSNIVNPYQSVYMVSVWEDAGWPAGTSWHISSYTPADGGVQVEIMSPSFTGLYGRVDFSVGWVHLCLVYEPVASQWTFYVNGAVSYRLTVGFSSVAGKLGVGMDTNPTIPPAQGMFDELVFWSRALTGSEVAQLYNHGNGLPYEWF
jgi:hypothetical protein